MSARMGRCRTIPPGLNLAAARGGERSA